MDERIVSNGFRRGDDEQETGLRPKSLAEYVGQESVKQNLRISIEAALKRHEPLVMRMFCPISAAMIPARVVLPSPGGP